MKSEKAAENIREIMPETRLKANDLNTLLDKFKNPESYTEDGFCAEHKIKFTAAYIKSPFSDKWLMLENTGCLKCLKQKKAEEASLYVRKLNAMRPIEDILNKKI